MTIQSIPVKDVLLDGHNFDDFIFTFPLSASALTKSIQKVGLLHPVCLVSHVNGWKIVYGAKRILACKELGWEKIPTQIFAERDLSLEEALKMSLEEDIQQRELNPVEKAKVLFKFQSLAHWKILKLVQDLAPRLDLPSSVEMVKNYLSLLNLETEMQIEIAQGNLTPAHAFLLVQLKPSDRQVIYEEVFKKCHPNLNEGRELIENLTDLEIIMKKSIKEILTTKTIKDFLNSPNKNPREKCAMLRKALKKMRYPQLTRLEDRFSQTLKSLSLKSNIHVRPSPFFEENYLDISFRAKDAKALNQTVESIVTASKNGGFDKLFKIVKGMI